MKKITLILSLCSLIATTALAQFNAGEQYRIKEKNTGLYLNIENHDTHNTGDNKPKGGVNLASLDIESDEQIFTAEEADGGYKLRANSGYYIQCWQWNVDASSTTDGTVLLFEENEEGYLIQWNNTYANNNSNGKVYFKKDYASGEGNSTEYVYCDAEYANAATWIIESIATAAPQRSIYVSSDNEEAGEVLVNGEPNEFTGEGPITLQANAYDGYAFDGWYIDNELISRNATYIDNTEGDKEYVAHFRTTAAEDSYATIEKPSFANPGNTTYAKSATISNGNGIENYSENIIPAELSIVGQQGRTDFIVVTPGATFDLEITYKFDWHDITIFKIVNGVTETLYGPFEGSWPDSPENVMKENFSNAGLYVNDNTVTFPIELGEELQDGDIVVIRTMSANYLEDETIDYSSGSYLDFVFEVKTDDGEEGEGETEGGDGGDGETDGGDKEEGKDEGEGETEGGDKEEGKEAAIEDVEAEATNAVIYDITGRRIDTITKAGIYIVNGKKVLVK